MVWTVEYDPRVEKDLRAIDHTLQREIVDYMDTRIATDEDPRRFGKSLRHERRPMALSPSRLPHRLDIRDSSQVVHVLTSKHRSIAYD